MPKRGNERSISHLAFTDHGIPRRPAGAGSGSGVVETLREFWSGVSNPRDTAMAYAAAGNPAAYPLLEEAARNSPRDVPLLSQLAQFHERAGQEEKAERLYEQILQLDPANPTAAVNLGIARIKKGKAQEAMALWQGALARSPWLIGARLNLAAAQYQSGNPAGAKASLQAVLDYEPAHAGARQMLLQIP
jgi:Flp pilus assembly protein TadD